MLRLTATIHNIFQLTFPSKQHNKTKTNTMAHTGTVISWSRAFGFVNMEDGTAVYINTEDIDGGRLRVGLSVSFDKADGKDGRVKGINVSGEAVLAKGAELVWCQTLSKRHPILGDCFIRKKTLS